MARRTNIAPNRHATHPFDLRFGTDTGGYLRPEDLQTGQSSDTLNNGYSAVAPSVFREACRLWRETLPVSAARLEAYSFIDVGAGKGRALLLAAELPFRKVVGIEISKNLAIICRENIMRWGAAVRLRTKIRVLQQDAVEFRWPDTPLLVYLNNPFECELVQQMADKLVRAAASGCGLVDIIYVNPGCAETLTRGEGFKLLWSRQIEMTQADQAADPYGASSDRVSVFRYVRRDI